MRCLVSLLFLSSAVVLGQATDIPVTNWSVPPYRAWSSSGGLTTMTDISPGVGFVAVQPCRVVDTRGGGVFTGTYGPPIMAAGATRPFDINSAPHCPGIPDGADAYSLNFTVTQTAGAPGDIRAWPTGNPPVQVTSVLNWTVPNATLANATIIPAGTGGSIDVVVAGAATHLLIDINGYFTDQYNPGVSFHAVSSTAPAIHGENTGSGYGVLGTSVNGFGVVATTGGNSSNAAVYGSNTSTGAGASGVYGQHTGSGYGVYGQSASGFGVVAATGGIGPNAALYAKNTSATNGSSGVFGWASASSGNVFGGKFVTDSKGNDSAGVKGVSGWGDPFGDTTGCSFCETAGVRGVDASDPTVDDDSYGVLGLSRLYAVAGLLLDSGGSVIARAELGAIRGIDDGVLPPWAVFASGNIGATGIKPFIDPHPTDPSRVIQYIALEGPEAGTYFRGKGKFERGIAVIEVPEDFRMVTDPEGLSIQVTPIGEMATVAVRSIGLDRIVIQGSRNVEFFYTVNGVRSTFRDERPIRRGSEFAPAKAEATIPGYLSEGQKRLLIQNGTYKEDGTVNMETARRLGWDKRWKERPTPQPAAQ
jgi:hypothetical protein